MTTQVDPKGLFARLSGRLKHPGSKADKLGEFLTKERHIYKPYLSFYLDIGFLRLRTDVMHRAHERDVYDYIRLDWKLFKWTGGFNLYKPGVDL